jgi:zinc protease
LPAHAVNFPPYQVQTLPNGLQVVVVLHHEQPAVSMRLLIRAGSSLDPKGKLGVAHLTASLLDQGTTTKSAGELNDAIDFIGGALDSGAGIDLSFVNTVVMKDSFEIGLRMLSDVARHPAFALAEIDRQRQQLLSNLQVSLEDPAFIADAVFDRLVFGFHPYGLPETGTPETIAAITRDDLVAFHDKYFAPNNAILAIVGDVTADEAMAAARSVFADWERRDIPVHNFIDPPDPTRRVILINKPDAVQTEVRVGHLGIQRNHRDYMAVNLAIRILGGEGSNRLHQVLRTKRGLTYGAQARMGTLKESGDFRAETNTRSEATGEVLRLIVDEFWRLQRERVSGRELADAQAYLTGSFPLTIETPDAIAMQVLNVIFYGLPVEQLQNFRDRVNAVGVDDIQSVARTYLKPDRLSIVLVGNAGAFASQLQAIGFSGFESIDLDNLDLTSVDFKRRKTVEAFSPALRLASYQQPAAAQAPTITTQEGASAKTLLDRVIAAKGGLATLRAIKTITAVTSAEMISPAGRIEARTTTYLEYPNHVRVETTLPEATTVQVYDGERAWIRDPRGVHDVSERMVRDLQTSLKRDTVTLLLAAEGGTVRPRLMPDVKDDDGRLHHALEFSGPGLDPVVLYIAPDTGLISKQTYVAGAPGQPIVEEAFSDYRDVDGVRVAYAAAVRRGGQPILERRVTDIKINAAIDPALFKRPAP